MRWATKTKKYLNNTIRLLKDISDYQRFNLQSNSINETYEMLKKDGLVVIDDFLTEKECEVLVGKIDGLIDKAENVIADELKSDHRLLGIDVVDDTFHKAFQSEKVIDLISGYLNTKGSFTMANRVSPIPGNLGSGGGWHRDSYIYPQVKLIVYLSDVTENNGPFQYIVGSHRLSKKVLGVVKADYNLDDEKKIPSRYTDSFIRSKFRTNALCTITGKKGTAILVDTSGIHRGAPIKEGIRYACTNYCFTTEVPEKMKTKFVKV
ncbi:MAG: phytanoyl-CoA dioxygenase family protein [Fulvivirga sp.]|uniref:phytanoyl-CoA dioxygenase family protein n=1 Tax=Fulvivirga sp. TaxID=1931237 RepID=UPI0032F07D43